jgi:hypothetical protein
VSDKPAPPQRKRSVTEDVVEAKPESKEPESKTAERGPLSPVQHDDDGWGDTPVQMRG